MFKQGISRGTFKSLLSLPVQRSFSILNYQFVANLTEDQLALQEQVQKFSKERIAPLADQMDKTNRFPMQLWKELGDLGFLGVTTPAEYGGSELDYTSHSLILEEISRACGAVGLSYAVHSMLVLSALNKHANEAQKKKYIPKLCSGEMIGAIAISEPDAGSDVISLKTTATKQGDKWILNGSKSWITNGPDADVVLVYAKSDPAANQKGMSVFLVEKGSKGFTTSPHLDKLGMRGSHTCSLFFENYEVPEENVLGTVNKGVSILMSGLDMERLMLSAAPVGIMQACLDTTLSYVTTREQFKKKIGEFQLMQGKVADMYTRMQSARGYLYSLVKAADKGVVNSADCAAVILFCAENSVKCGLDTIQALGGNGYINEYPAGRYLRDAKIYSIAAGTNEIRRWLIGRELIGPLDKKK